MAGYKTRIFETVQGRNITEGELMSYNEQRVATLIADAERALADLREALRVPPQIPLRPLGSDAIDLSKAIITNESPDVRNWPIGAAVESITLSATNHMAVDFTKRVGSQAWPFVAGPEGGEIQYTLWIGC